MTHRHHHTIEALESRIAPAGLITATLDAAGTLTLLANDGLDHSIHVFNTGLNTYRVEGDAGTSTSIGTNGNPFTDILGKVTSVIFTGGAGADSLTTTNLLTLKTLTFSGDAGSDTLHTFNLTTTAGVTVNLGPDGGGVTFDGVTKIGGDATVNYGADGGSTTFFGTSATVKGAVVLNGGAGADLLGVSANANVFGKGVKFTGGAGQNQLTIDGVATTLGKGLTGNALEFTGSDDGNILSVIGTSFSAKGNVLFTAGAGSDSMALNPVFLKVDGSLTADVGGGVDDLEISPLVGAIKGAVTLKLGEGDGNSVRIEPQTLALGSSLTVTGGLLGDSFAINDGASVSIKGPALIDLGGGTGADFVNLTSTTLTFGSSLTVKDSAASSLSVNSDAIFLSVKGLLDVESGSGDSVVQVSAKQMTVGALTVKTGVGLDLAQFLGVKLTVGGSVSVDTGLATDFVDFGYDKVAINGGVSILTGDGSDGASFFADGVVKGDVLIDLGTGSDGASSADIGGTSGIAGNLKIGGKLTIASATTGAANSEELTVKEITVGKAVLINLGVVDSVVTIDNLIAKDTFTLNTGAGKDEVNIEQGTLFGPSVFSKAVTINLGDGDDTFRMGISSAAGSSSFAKFLAAVTVDGGADTDASNDFLNPATNFFAPLIVKTRSNFEGAFI